MGTLALEILLSVFGSRHRDDPRWMRVVGAILWVVILALFLGFIALWLFR